MNGECGTLNDILNKAIYQCVDLFKQPKVKKTIIFCDTLDHVYKVIKELKKYGCTAYPFHRKNKACRITKLMMKTFKLGSMLHVVY